MYVCTHPTIYPPFTATLTLPHTGAQGRAACMPISAPLAISCLKAAQTNTKTHTTQMPYVLQSLGGEAVDNEWGPSHTLQRSVASDLRQGKICFH